MFKIFSNLNKTNKKYWFFVFIIAIFFTNLIFNSPGVLPARMTLSGWKVAYSTIDPSSQEAQKLKESYRAQIQDLEKQIENYRALIDQKQNEANTLKNQIYIVQKQINKQELEIRESTLTLKYINEEIKDTLAQIANLEEKLKIEKNSLSEYVRIVYEYNKQPLLFLILKGDLSDFFNDLYAIENIQKKIQSSLVVIEKLKDQLKSDNEELEGQKEEMNSVLVIQKIQKNNLVQTQKYKNDLLSQTKGEENLYKEYLKRAQKTAAEIRKQLYVLEGWGISISFEEAYQKAKKISDKVGIRPAFLLALLKVESNWGQNVGRGTWKSDMKPTQYDSFLEIISKLGLNADEVPVSRRQVCPSGVVCGWGGALGPAQFLPSTWLLYEDKISDLTNHMPPSPWDVDDAFAAAAIKLAEAGATRQTYNSEWKAAMIYFAGSNWSKSIYRFYGDNVMALAKQIQQDINVMTQ